MKSSGIVALGVAALGAFVLYGAKNANANAKAPQPTTLEGTPKTSTEKAGVHTYEVQTWPEQADGLVYKFVKLKDSPGVHGVLFSEGPGPGVEFRRLFISGSGPQSVINTIRGEWIIQ